MGYKLAFYSVMDNETGKLIHESRDAFYIAQKKKMGISYQKIVACANAQKLVYKRYIIYTDEVMEVGFPPEWREWFIKEWHNMQRMFHVKPT